MDGQHLVCHPARERVDSIIVFLRLRHEGVSVLVAFKRIRDDLVLILPLALSVALVDPGNAAEFEECPSLFHGMRALVPNESVAHCRPVFGGGRHELLLQLLSQFRVVRIQCLVQFLRSLRDVRVIFRKLFAFLFDLSLDLDIDEVLEDLFLFGRDDNVAGSRSPSALRGHRELRNCSVLCRLLKHRGLINDAGRDRLRNAVHSRADSKVFVSSFVLNEAKVLVPLHQSLFVRSKLRSW